MKVLRFVVIVMSFLLFCSIAYARLPDYGYIIGTLDRFAYLNKKNVSTPYGIEKTSMQGQFLHYYFWVNVNGISYECVIDIKNSILYNAPYRVINMRNSNSSLYGGILGQSSRSYNFENHNPNTPGNGGLDYIRHPGILKDMAGGRDWQENYRPEYSEIVNPYEQYTPLLYTGHEFEYDDAWDKLYVRHCDNNDDVCEVDLYYADAIDALFNNVSKIYVFGQFYDFGYGMHNIHQNQGNRYNNNTYISNGDIYQDGAVIFEYPDGKRKMLMVKFGDHNDNSGINMNMIDFTAPTAGE